MVVRMAIVTLAKRPSGQSPVCLLECEEMQLFNLISLTCLLLVHPAFAQGKSISVPGDAASITEAIAMASDGDRIELGPGTYYESIVLNDRELTIEGVEGPDRTVVDATSFKQPVITIRGGKDDRITIRGMAFTGGTGDEETYGKELTIGGGMLVRGASPLVENCRFMGNVVSGQGGAVWVGESAAPRFLRCRFTANRAERGGGVYTRNSESTFLDCDFNANTANFAGGGIAIATGSVLTVLDSKFDECTTTFNGGGIHISESTAEIERTRFIRCAAGLAGGAIYVGYNGRAELSDNELRTIADTVHVGWHRQNEPPKGACCIAERCIETIESACDDVGGRWSGAGTDCVSVRAACPVATPGDLDGNDRVDIRDVGILMSLWGDE